MSVYIIKSNAIANDAATPPVLNDPIVDSGIVHQSEGYVQTGSATDAVGSLYKMCKVPSNARVSEIKFQCDALGGSGAVNVGVYYPEYIPQGAGLLPSLASTAISAAFFASALSVVSATAETGITNQSGTNTIAKQELPLWSAVGLASDPGIELDICVAVSTVIAAQGYVGLKVSYVR